MPSEEVKKLLEGNDKAEELGKLIDDDQGKAVKKAEEKSGKEASKKANAEAKNVRERYKKSWLKLELDPEDDEFDDNVKKLKELHEGNITELEELKDEKGKKGEKGNKDIQDLTKLVKELQKSNEKLTTNLTESEKTGKEKTKKVNRSGVESEIISILTEGKAIKPKLLLPTIMESVKLENEDGDEFSAKYVHGDDELEIKVGVNKFLEENPEFVSNNGSPGGESGGHKGGSGTPNKSEVEKSRDRTRSYSSNTI